MTSTRSDADAIHASFAEPETFSEIFERHYDAIFQYLARRTRHGAAEDLTCDVFTVAFDIRDRFDLTSPSARPWLYGIAHRVLMRHYRVAERSDRALRRMHIEHVTPDMAEAIVVRLDLQNVSTRFASAIETITPLDREPLLMSVCERLSYNEISEALQVPVGTVRSRIARARAELRELLGHNGQQAGAPTAREGAKK